jgi:hypothetical protein
VACIEKKRKVEWENLKKSPRSKWEDKNEKVHEAESSLRSL